MISERDIQIEGVRENDPVALTQFVKCYSPMVQSVVGAVLDDPMDVDDCVQDTFLKALSALGSFDPSRASMATWLSRIAYRTALNYVRDHSRRRLVRIENMVAEPRNEEDSTKTSEDEKYLLQAINMLDSEDRTLLHLYYFNDLSLNEISYIMMAKKRTLASRLFRLRGRLYKLISTLRDR